MTDRLVGGGGVGSASVRVSVYVNVYIHLERVILNTYVRM